MHVVLDMRKTEPGGGKKPFPGSLGPPPTDIVQTPSIRLYHALFHPSISATKKIKKRCKKCHYYYAMSYLCPVNIFQLTNLSLNFPHMSEQHDYKPISDASAGFNLQFTPELTYGQKAVGVTFNPSQDPDVAAIKAAYAAIIDQMNYLRANAVSSEVKRLCSIAITEAQGAQMWAVKAITWKD